MKTSLIIASLVAAFAFGLFYSPSPQGPVQALETMAIAKTQDVRALNTEPAKKAQKKQPKVTVGSLPAPPLAAQYSYNIDGTQVYAATARTGLNGYSVTETPHDAPLFMRVFEKDGHVLAAFNYQPAAIPVLDGAAKAPSSGPYSITIMRGGEALAKVSVQEHHSGQE